MNYNLKRREYNINASTNRKGAPSHLLNRQKGKNVDREKSGS